MIQLIFVENALQNQNLFISRIVFTRFYMVSIRCRHGRFIDLYSPIEMYKIIKITRFHIFQENQYDSHERRRSVYFYYFIRSCRKVQGSEMIESAAYIYISIETVQKRVKTIRGYHRPLEWNVKNQVAVVAACVVRLSYIAYMNWREGAKRTQQYKGMH